MKWKKSIIILIIVYFFRYESAFTFLINLFLEARAEIKKIISLGFRFKWEQQKKNAFKIIWPLAIALFDLAAIVDTHYIQLYQYLYIYNYDQGCKSF